ncbi:MAG: peptidase T [Chitinispirillaceae bacterium]|nr:peptidase T [Chitinispirillaceae bacterium]
MKQRALETFLRYIAIDTQAKEGSETFPSTKGQRDFAQLLKDELHECGLEDVQIDSFGYLFATIPHTIPEKVPVIGLLAHLDTSPEVSGNGIKPRIIDRYTGGDIIINKELNIRIMEAENEKLKECIGHTLVTSDGTTLVGADDKAGVTAIMTLVRELRDKPYIPHGTIRIAFTPDEEVGKGPDHFSVEKFGADYAYTIDGGFVGELNKETFSANTALITAEGRTIHPGVAKGRMVNAVRVIGEIIARLPVAMAPETTDGYKPFIHPLSVTAEVDFSRLKLILRDFRTEGLNEQETLLKEIINEVRDRYPKAKISLEITESYRNMREEIEKHPLVMDNIRKAAQQAGVSPYWKPIRGGTDGARITAMGLPTPNVFTGSCNHHSVTEWLSVDGLVKVVETLLRLVEINCETS